MREREMEELENGIARELLHVSRLLFQRSARVMESMNIGAGQAPILKLLEERGTMTQRQIAQAVRVTPATVCGTLKRMERAGLIRREPNAEDARSSCVSLTERGRASCARATEVLHTSYGEMLRGFSEAECRQIADFFVRMGENLSQTTETDEDA